MNRYYNILSNTTTSLNDARTNPIQIERMSLCNTSGSAVTFSIHIESIYINENEIAGAASQPSKETLEKYYIVKDLSLLNGQTAIFEELDLIYDITRFDLKIYSDKTLDAIITDKNKRYEYINKTAFRRSY